MSFLPGMTGPVAAIPATLIDRTTGANISGEGVASGGVQNPDAAFDGDTTQTFLVGLYVNNAVSQTVYAGKTTAVPTAVESVLVFGSTDQGFVDSSNPSTTITLYGKTGAAPSNGTDGTSLGSVAFTDTADESAGRSITSSDTATYWDHVWVNVTSGAGNFNRGIAEIQITGWIA